jgi:hypothetical protein
MGYFCFVCPFRVRTTRAVGRALGFCAVAGLLCFGVLCRARVVARVPGQGFTWAEKNVGYAGSRTASSGWSGLCDGFGVREYLEYSRCSVILRFLGRVHLLAYPRFYERASEIFRVQRGFA